MINKKVPILSTKTLKLEAASWNHGDTKPGLTWAPGDLVITVHIYVASLSVTVDIPRPPVGLTVCVCGGGGGGRPPSLLSATITRNVAGTDSLNGCKI